MELFKRAPGVVLFAVIWLLVLLIPLWRLRVSRHWESSQLIPVQSITDTGPSIQLGFGAESEQRLREYSPNDPTALLYLQGKTPTITEPRPSSLPGAVPGVDSDTFFQRYGDLARRFPNNLAIRSKWLLDTTRGPLAVETPDSLARSQATNKELAFLKYRPSWISRQQTEAALACAIQGTKLDPQNSYWPWMEAVFAFSLRREEQGLMALEAAGRCSRFDDGTVASVKRESELLHRVQPSDTEDALNIMWSILLPHYSKLNEVAREAMWDAQKAYDSGDRIKALKIASHVQRAGATVANGQGSYISFLVGKAIVNLAWQRTLEMAEIEHMPNTSTKSDPGIADGRPVRFESLARSLGQRDIADETLKIATDIGPSSPGSMVKQFAWSQINPLSGGMYRLMVLQWLGWWLLRLALCGAILWLVTYILTRGQETAIPSLRRGAAIAAAFSTGVTGVLLWNALHSGLNGTETFNIWDSKISDSNVEDILPLGLVFTWLIPLLILTFTAQRRRPENKRPITNIWAALTLALVMIFALLLRSTTHIPQGSSYGGQVNLTLLLIFNLSSLGLVYLKVRNAPKMQKVYMGLLVGALLCFTTLLFFNSDSRNAITSVSSLILRDQIVAALTITAIVLALFGVAFAIRAADYKRVMRNDWFRDTIQCFRITAAALAVMSSIAYFVLALDSTQIHRQVQFMVERQLEIGEIAFLQEQMKNK